jgi:PmbA protein
MIKEYFSNQTIEEKIKIENNQIQSFRSKNIIQKSVRVFDEKNKIFALGCATGNVPDSDLEAKATELLSLKLPFDYELEKDLKADFTMDKLSVNDLEAFTEKVLHDLKDYQSNYVISGASGITEEITHIKNSQDLDLRCAGKSIYIYTNLKQKGSSNIMDIGTGLYGFDITDRKYQSYLKDTEFMAKAYLSENVNLENKTYKILCPPNMLLDKFSNDINGIEYEEKSSLLAGKQFEQIFNEKVNIVECRITHENGCLYMPFDGEGIVGVYDKPIVENGVLKTILYNKKNAKKYGKKSTGNGFRNYNGNAYIGCSFLKFIGDFAKCSDVINGEYVILPIMAEGGDFLPNGNYSQPVQLAFVFQNGKFIGKAPQMSITGNYLDGFNQDLRAFCKNDMWENLFGSVMMIYNGAVSLI